VDVAGARWSWDRSPALRWLLLDEDTTGEPDTVVALCADVDGLFVDTPAPPPARLLGCRPEPPLRRALEALARGAGNPGGALWRRRITTSICTVAEDGTATPVVDGFLGGSVMAAVPSTLGEGLLDVTLDAAVHHPMPTGAREIWELWRTGRPAERGAWVRYDRLLRHHWSGAALAHHLRAADRPAGSEYHLDGRHVTDLEGFFCAIGEAVNGPGGYFGWNADALNDCARGRWGAAPPFRLVWHDSAVARRHLAAGTTSDDVLSWLAEAGIDVDLR
jgi:hypothetical protein